MYKIIETVYADPNVLPAKGELIGKPRFKTKEDAKLYMFQDAIKTVCRLSGSDKSFSVELDGKHDIVIRECCNNKCYDIWYYDIKKCI